MEVLPKSKKRVGDYDIGRTIGKGAFSKVKKAKNARTGEEVAMKIVDMDVSNEQEIDREVAILKLLRHPNIVRLLDVMRGEKQIYLAFELVQGGDMFDFTVSRGTLPEREARRLMREVVAAVAYCHAHLVVHRDLKLENLLIDSDGHVRISDFGLSNIMKPGLRLETICGSPLYMPPEIVEGLSYGPAVDVWSLGIVLFTLVTGAPPWHMSNNRVQDMDRLLAAAYVIPDESKVSASYKDLMSRMIVSDQANRATIYEVMAHPWMCEGYDGPVRIDAKVLPISTFDESILSQMEAMGFAPRTSLIRKSNKIIVPDSNPDAHGLVSPTSCFCSPEEMVYQLIMQQKSTPKKLNLIDGSGGHPDLLSAAAKRAAEQTHANAHAQTQIQAHAPLSRPRFSPIGKAAPVTPNKRTNNPYGNISGGPINDEEAAKIAAHAARGRRSSLQNNLPSMMKRTPMQLISEESEPQRPSSTTNLAALKAKSGMKAIAEEEPEPERIGTRKRHSGGDPQDTIPASVPSPTSSPSVSSPASNSSSSPPSGRSRGMKLRTVKGSFSVETTTLKPKGTIRKEIERVLKEEGVEYRLDGVLFHCKKMVVNAGDKENSSPTLRDSASPRLGATSPRLSASPHSPRIPPLSLASPVISKLGAASNPLGNGAPASVTGSLLRTSNNNLPRASNASSSPNHSPVLPLLNSGSFKGLASLQPMIRHESNEDICWLGKLKFEIEICRVGGMEMLLGLSFRRSEGSVWV